MPIPLVPVTAPVVVTDIAPLLFLATMPLSAPVTAAAVILMPEPMTPMPVTPAVTAPETVTDSAPVPLLVAEMP